MMIIGVDYHPSFQQIARGANDSRLPISPNCVFDASLVPDIEKPVVSRCCSGLETKNLCVQSLGRTHGVKIFA